MAFAVAAAYSSNEEKSKKSRKKKTYMPTDVLLSIFVRLPASSLQRFKTASKLWFRVISDPQFVESHLAKQLRGECRKFIVPAMYANLLIEKSKPPRHLLLIEKSKPPQHLGKPGPAAHGPFVVHGSCKGLIIYHCSCSTCRPLKRDFEKINNIAMQMNSLEKFLKLHVANPITGETLRLPPYRQHCGPHCEITIECDREAHIKVVLIAEPFDPKSTSFKACLVLTLGGNAWRNVNIPSTYSLGRKPIAVGGDLHWLCDTGVLTLDLAQEKFHQTEINFISPSVRALINLDGCLTVVSIRQGEQIPFYKLWALRESGWTKLPDLDIAFFEHLYPSESFSYSGLDRPYLFASLGNGKTIMFWKVGEDNIDILAYDVNRGVMMAFAQVGKAYLGYKQGIGFAFIDHVDSLVSCKANSSTPAPVEEEAFDWRLCRRDDIRVNCSFSSVILSMVQVTAKRFNIFWSAVKNIFGLENPCMYFICSSW